MSKDKNLLPFMIALIHNPPSENGKATKKERASFLLEPTWILATSQEEAQIKCHKKIPDEYEDKLDEITVCISPF